MNARDLELVAALADGRLQGAERAALLARIEGDEALYEVYVEALRDLEATAEDRSGVGDAAAPGAEPPGTQSGVSDEHPTPTVLDFPTRRRPIGGLLAAAAVLLAALALFVWNGRDAVVPYGTLAARAGISGGLGSGWQAHGWSVTRGDGPSDSVRSSMRAGVLITDLAAAVAAEDRGATAALINDLRVTLTEQPFSQPALIALRRAAENPGSLAPDLPEIEPAVGAAVDAEAYTLGRWVETLRLLWVAGLTDQAESLGPPRLSARLRVRLGEELAERLDGVIESDAGGAERVAEIAALIAGF